MRVSRLVDIASLLGILGLLIGVLGAVQCVLNTFTNPQKTFIAAGIVLLAAGVFALSALVISGLQIQEHRRDLATFDIRERRGFTLIELVIVLVILGILGVIVVPQIVSMAADEKARKKTNAE